MAGELGERVVPGLGVAWGDMEACPRALLWRVGVRSVPVALGWGGWRGSFMATAIDAACKVAAGSHFRGTRMSQREGDSPEGLNYGEGGFISSRPTLLSPASFALLGIDPQRPLVDSLIEN